MQRSTSRILTTHTGSLPRPPELVDQVMQDHDQRRLSSRPEFANQVKDAVVAVAPAVTADLAVVPAVTVVSAVTPAVTRDLDRRAGGDVQRGGVGGRTVQHECAGREDTREGGGGARVTCGHGAV